MQTYFRTRQRSPALVHFPAALLRLRLRRLANRAAREIHLQAYTRPSFSWMARRMQPADPLRRTPRRPRPPRRARSPMLTIRARQVANHRGRVTGPPA